MKLFTLKLKNLLLQVENLFSYFSHIITCKTFPYGFSLPQASASGENFNIGGKIRNSNGKLSIDGKSFSYKRNFYRNHRSVITNMQSDNNV